MNIKLVNKISGNFAPSYLGNYQGVERINFNLVRILQRGKRMDVVEKGYIRFTGLEPVPAEPGP